MIQQMKKVFIAGRNCDREALLTALYEAGVVHVEPVDANAVKLPQKLVEDAAKVEKALKILDELEPASAAAAAPPGTPARLVEEVHAQSELLARLNNDLTNLLHEYSQVKPWGRIHKEDIESLIAAGLDVKFCFCPASNIDDCIISDIIKIISETDGVAAVLAISRGPIEIKMPARAVNMPERDSFELEETIAAIEEEKDRVLENLRELAMRRDEIRAYSAELCEKLEFQRVESSLAEDGPVFVLQGWVPEKKADALHTTLENEQIPVALFFQNPADDEVPPTAFENPPWIRPVESLFSLLGVVPGYREPDISPAFMPFLALFTAMLIGDAGYGFVSCMALLVGRKRLLAKRIPKNVLDLFTILFAGTGVWGALTNNWFGFQLLKAPLIPTDELFLKSLCFLIGAVHLTIAHIWKLKRSSPNLTTIAEVGWLLFIWPMWALIEVLVNGRAVPGWMLPMFGVSLSMIILFTDFSWNILLAVAKGLGAVALSAAGFLGDIISYIRLWAVGLAGGVLAATFNGMLKPLPLLVAFLIGAAAHFMNFALGLVALFAHGIRLNLLEFSNHLGMEWTGREYNPFGKKL